MLPPPYRLNDRKLINMTIKTGTRVSGKQLVVHYRHENSETKPRIAFAVSKLVGNSVVRNRVSRKLRPLAMANVWSIPPGSFLVIRALPNASAASSAELAADLRRVLPRAITKFYSRQENC